MDQQLSFGQEKSLIPVYVDCQTSTSREGGNMSYQQLLVIVMDAWLIFVRIENN